MSLISEALKKAQAQQQGQPTPGSSQTPPPVATVPLPPPTAVPLPAPVTDERKSTSRSIVVTAIAAIALTFMLGGGLIVWGVLQLSTPRQETTAIVSATEAPAAPPSSSTPPPQNTNTNFVSPETNPSPVEAPLPTSTTPAPQNATAPLTPITFKVEEVSTPTPQAATAPTPQATTAPTPPPATALISPEITQPPPTPAPPVQVPEIRQRIATLEIRGIMRGGGKVLLYDPELQRSRAFSNDDLVDATLGIRIFSISPQELVFLDAQGARYLKRF